MQRHSGFDRKTAWRLKETEGDLLEEDSSSGSSGSGSGSGSSSSSSDEDVAQGEVREPCPVCGRVVACRNARDMAEHAWQQHRVAKGLRDRQAAFDFVMRELLKRDSPLGQLENVLRQGAELFPRSKEPRKRQCLK